MATNTYAQIAPRSGYMITQFTNTWIYPVKFLNIALDAKIVPYRYDGVNIVCKDRNTLASLYTDIYDYTTNSYYGGINNGFDIQAGTLLQDYGREIYLRTEDNSFWIHWRLVKQLTEQETSPNGTVGFIAVDSSYGYNPPTAEFDYCCSLRLG